MHEDNEHVLALREAFLEEAEDHLQHLESGLLALAQGEYDPELVHSVFRAAHSIKGGAGAFGFPELVGLTHWMETLLDSLRSGSSQPTADEASALLEARDALAQLVTAAAMGYPADRERADLCEERLKAITRRTMAPSGVSLRPPGLPQPQPQPQPNISQFKIAFVPQVTLLRSGNDPLGVLRELAGLGELSIRVDDTALPPLSEMEEDVCYLVWELSLLSSASREDVLEVFSWIQDDCELTVVESSAPNARAQQSLATPSATSKGAHSRPAERAGGMVPAAAVSSSVRVPVHKLDELVDVVGELVNTLSVLEEVARGPLEPELQNGLDDALRTLSRQVQDLRWRSVGLRTLPLSHVFRRMPSLIRDTGRALGKELQLVVEGQELEVDKTVIEQLNDPLVHLLRNAADHGIEDAATRVAAGKPSTGCITLRAVRRADLVLVQVSDDGSGIDRERVMRKAIERGLLPGPVQLTDQGLQEIIFSPGFSTAAQVTDVSGRGVGLDVVRTNIRGVGGDIALDTGPSGTTFTISLPLSLTIIDAQLVRICDRIFVVPLAAIKGHLSFEPQRLHRRAGAQCVYCLDDGVIPLLDGAEELAQTPREQEPRLVVILEGTDQRFGLLADALVAQQSVVVRSLSTNYRDIPGIAGASILGDGAVVLIIDPVTLSKVATPKVTASPDLPARFSA